MTILAQPYIRANGTIFDIDDLRWKQYATITVVNFDLTKKFEIFPKHLERLTILNVEQTRFVHKKVLDVGAFRKKFKRFKRLGVCLSIIFSI